MGYTDPDRDSQIRTLRRQLAEERAHYDDLHKLWRAGLRQANDDHAWGVVNALSWGNPDGSAST
jgi:hypothetical protein